MSDSVIRGRPFFTHGRSAPVTYREAPSRNEKNGLKCLALVARWSDRARIRDALAGIAELQFVTTNAGMLQALRAGQDGIRAVLLEAHDSAGRPTAGLVRQITILFPTIPVVGYCSQRPEESQDILSLSSAGVHELVFKQQDDHALLCTILDSAHQACVADLVLHHLDGRLPVRVRPLVEYCLTNPEQAHAVDDVARALGVSRRTLVNHCRAERFLAPSAVVAWCLILLAGGMLAAPGVTVERIALQLNFPSATALRNMLRRHTGRRPAELRTTEALAELCAAFLCTATRTDDGS